MMAGTLKRQMSMLAKQSHSQNLQVLKNSSSNTAQEVTVKFSVLKSEEKECIVLKISCYDKGKSELF